MSKSKERKEMDENLRKEIGQRLRQEREARYKSQGEAVAHIDYRIISDESAYSRYESGNASIPFVLLKNLHDQWGIDLNWLIAGDASQSVICPPEVKDALKTIANYLKAK